MTDVGSQHAAPRWPHRWTLAHLRENTRERTLCRARRAIRTLERQRLRRRDGAPWVPRDRD